LISGPAGTGKSRACLEKLYSIARWFPGSRGLIVRKTRESLTESALYTFERFVLGLDHPLVVNGPQRRNRQRYVFANGSEIMVAGLRSSGRDTSEKVMSTEYTSIYAQEAIELAVGDLERLTTRLRATGSGMPWRQFMADTNPGPPRHWLRLRCLRGAMGLLNSQHIDNPILWDADRGEWTELGVAYIARLDALTGVRKDRLRWGRWVQAEGIVYTEWNPAVNLIEPFDIPDEWSRFRAIDFGYARPFVCLWFAVDHDGRMYCYRQIYHTGRTVATHARQIVALTGEEEIDATVCDHDSEDRATLAENGIPNIPAKKAVLEGIDKVQQRLKVQADGRARLYFFDLPPVEIDRALMDDHLPVSTHEEWDAYVWANTTKEKPVKANDHGLDATRYGVAYEDLAVGSFVG
jgi:phage terminase large subunit